MLLPDSREYLRFSGLPHMAKKIGIHEYVVSGLVPIGRLVAFDHRSGLFVSPFQIRSAIGQQPEHAVEFRLLGEPDQVGQFGRRKLQNIIQQNTPSHRSPAPPMPNKPPSQPASPPLVRFPIEGPAGITAARWRSGCVLQCPRISAPVRPWVRFSCMRCRPARQAVPRPPARGNAPWGFPGAAAGGLETAPLCPPWRPPIEY